MKTLLLNVVALGAIVLFPSAGLAKSGWKTYSDAAGGFSISMPGQPNSMPEFSTKLPSGDVLNYYGMGVVQENAQGIKTAYIVTYTDLPIAYGKNTKAASNALTSIDCRQFGFMDARRTVSQQSFRLSGYPGKEIKCKGDSGTTAKVRTFLVNNRVYVLLAATNHEPSAVKSMEGFMKSFSLR